MTLSFRSLGSTKRSFWFLLLLNFASYSSAGAQRNNFSGLSGETCQCCNLNLRSRCCAQCLADLAGMGRNPELPVPISRLAQEGRLGEDEAGNREDFTDAERSQGSPFFPPCLCCKKEYFLLRRQGLLLMACCYVCEKSLKLASAAGGQSLTADLSSSRQGMASNEPETRRVASGLQKRMTSMDCMCCMNSGISDCCSRCRIF